MLPTEQPVRFYKVIAFTFFVITVFLLGIIAFTSSKRATILIETKAEPIDVSGTVVIGANGSNTLGFATSTVVTFTNIVSPGGGSTVDAIATGFVTLHNDTSSPQTLIPTTRLLAENGVLFRLKNRVTIPAEGSIEAEAYADLPGVSGNLEPTKFTIPGLSVEKQAVIYATSDKALGGGTRQVGIFTDADKKQAEMQIRDQLLELGKKVFASYTNDYVLAYALNDATITFDTPVGTETDRVTVSGEGVIAAAAYPKDAVDKFVKETLAKRAVDDTEVIERSQDEPTISIDQVNLANQTATIKIFSTGLAALNPESERLVKSVFFGKNRDEIRRHVLSLDHVYGVTVELQPVWTLRVPAIPDHVSVVVKKVE
ncbi:MAG: hypothetical protein AAB408_02085 [Patescibacteria group bacterium]